MFDHMRRRIPNSLKSFDQGPPAGLSSPARGHWFTLRGSCEEGHPGVSVSPRAQAAHAVSCVAWPTRTGENIKQCADCTAKRVSWNEVGQVQSGQLYVESAKAREEGGHLHGDHLFFSLHKLVDMEGMLASGDHCLGLSECRGRFAGSTSCLSD